jgi:RHH-type proline utilization regulon transcriptional repressor/proline dehydrogenase/delta 1-pyrroline-5-carboxylate dehydrogenase
LLPAGVAAWLEAHSVPVKVEDDDAWHARLTFRPETIEVGGPATPPKPIHRIRLIGGNGLTASRALRGDPEVAIYDAPVTASGRVELLPFFREQAISITNHRYGAIVDLTDAVI